jgi:dihydrofolate reductase
MRNLKLQMQVTVDGYVAGPEGQLDWMTFDMDAGLLAFINHLTDTSDTILLGRKMTGGFIKYWEHVVTQEDSPEHEFAQKMVGLPKVVFSKTLQHVDGKNVRVENGDMVDAVKQLKNRPGKDISPEAGGLHRLPVRHRREQLPGEVEKGSPPCGPSKAGAGSRRERRVFADTT